VTGEPLAQPAQAVSIRRRGTDVDRLAITVEQVEVETLPTEIQTGVQHRNTPPLRQLQTTRRSLSLGRPFFMAFLTMGGGLRAGWRKLDPLVTAVEEERANGLGLHPLADVGCVGGVVEEWV
jgi:hypothetical protein